MSIGRPGEGGRQPRTTPFTTTSATAELIAQVGQPRQISIAGAQILVWVYDEAGDGIISGRLSGREVQNGETVMGQVHPALELCERLGLTPRLLIASLSNTGARDYEQRADFGLIEEAVRSGWCEWTMWRDIGRLAREPVPQELFLRFTRETGTDLYLTRLGRAVEWDQDRLQLRTLGAFSAEERENIKRQTHDALIARWLAEGRGWPGSKRFGFRRNPVTKFLEVDPEQWEFVKRIHYGYAQLEREESQGIRRLSTELSRLGCQLSPTRLRKILRDPIYVSGEWSVDYQGQRYPGRPIELADPIPPGVFERNRQLLAARQGKNNHTPAGTFCLNQIPVIHAVCADQRNRRGLRSLLRGRIQGKRRSRRYKHSPWIPKCCRGYAIEQRDLEEAVLTALGQLVSAEALRAAWEEADHRRRLVDARPFLDPDAKRQLAQRRRTLKRQQARLERHFLDRLADGEEADERSFAELTAAVREELEMVERRLDQAESSWDGTDLSAQAKRNLERALAEALPIDVPTSATDRHRRATLVAALLERIVVHDRDDGIHLELVSRVGNPDSGSR